MPHREGHLLVDGQKKQALNIHLSIVKLLITLCVSINPVTTKIQAFFLTQFPETRRPLRDFTMRPKVT